MLYEHDTLLIDKKNEVFMTVQAEPGLARELSDFHILCSRISFHAVVSKQDMGWQDTTLQSTKQISIQWSHRLC